jgi:branched-chain amino acid transport system ATP-binding protein
VLHRPAHELLADPNIERLFLGGAHSVSGDSAAAPVAGRVA